MANSISDVVKKVEKQKANTIFYGDLLKSLVVDRINSGVFVFDYLTRGGIPKGRITQFHGVKSSNKSTFSLFVAENFMKQYPDSYVVYVDFEHTYDYNWSKNFISKFDKFYLYKPDYGEQGVDAINEFAKSVDVGLIIVDSIGAMIPTAEVEGSATDDWVGVHAKLVNKMLRKLILASSERNQIGNKLTTILINQVRANIGHRAFQPTTSLPGGEMLKHVISMDVKFYPKTYVDVKGIPAKATFGFSVEKNKTGIPKVSGEYTIYLRDVGDKKIGYIEDAETVMTYGKSSGVIVRLKSKWKCLDEEFNNIDSLVSRIASDEAFATKLKYQIINAGFGQLTEEGDTVDS